MDKEKLNNKIEAFLKNKKSDDLELDKNEECHDEICMVNSKEDIVHKENKILITNDGRQLLI